MATLKSLIKGIGSGVGSGAGRGSISQRFVSGSAPKCHGSPIGTNCTGGEGRGGESPVDFCLEWN